METSKKKVYILSITHTIYSGLNLLDSPTERNDMPVTLRDTRVSLAIGIIWEIAVAIVNTSLNAEVSVLCMCK